VYLQSDQLASRYRNSAIDLPGRRVLVTNFRGTEQERDLSEPANCEGFGRVRHFMRKRSKDWVENPLPLDPAARALDLGFDQQLRAQVFQNAVCNWRCWYCFVPFALLDANKNHSQLMTAGDLIELWLRDPERPDMIDLTGGQPELVPEWVLWMMEELQQRGLEKEVYLWSDDNLSADYFWTALSAKDRDFMACYSMYSRVCCFKGFDDHSFSFNTMVSPDEYGKQFERMAKLMHLGLDLYAYVTFTTAEMGDVASKMNRFVDRLQRLDENFPLRTVPLKIEVFSPTASRLNTERRSALDNQFRVMEVWHGILEERFSAEQRGTRICDVPLAMRLMRGK
jgi:organic radical activating enzyme